MHFHPNPSPIIKRYEFNVRRQKPGESIAEFLMAIWKIADNCEYCWTIRFVTNSCVALQTKGYKNQLPKLTYTVARDMALAAKAAKKDAKRLQKGHNNNTSSPGG